MVNSLPRIVSLLWERISLYFLLLSLSLLVSLLKIVCFLFSFLHESREYLFVRFFSFCRTDGNKTAKLSDDLWSYGIVQIHMLRTYFISNKRCTGMVSSAPLCCFYIRAAAAASKQSHPWMEKALKAIFSRNLEYRVHSSLMTS